MVSWLSAIGVLKPFGEWGKIREQNALLRRSEHNEDVLWQMVLNLVKQNALYARTAAPTIEERNKLEELNKEQKKLKRKIK